MTINECLEIRKFPDRQKVPKLDTYITAQLIRRAIYMNAYAQKTAS